MILNGSRAQERDLRDLDLLKFQRASLLEMLGDFGLKHPDSKIKGLLDTESKETFKRVQCRRAGRQ